jgi:phage-related protein
MYRKPLLEIPKYTKRPKRNEPKTSITKGVKNLPKWSGAKVMIKVTYTNKNLEGALHYIQHREKNTPKRELITANGEINEKDFIKQMNANGKKFYKFIISPEEQLTKEELEKTVKKTMEELEKRYSKLLYAFVIHENTDHRHAHVVMSARSRNRANIKIGKKMLFGMKEAAVNKIWEIKQSRQIDITQAIKNIANDLGSGLKDGLDGLKKTLKFKI